MAASGGQTRRAGAPADTVPDIQLPGTDAPADRAALARELSQDRHALVLALAETLCWHDENARAHLRRVQAFVRCLAEEAVTLPSFRGRIDSDFIQLVEWCAPLHDLGKVAVPAAVLEKPGALQVMLQESPGHFDPDLLSVFEKCAARFADHFGPLG